MDDATLLQSFEMGTLSPADFHHADHLRVAWVMLAHYPLAEALGRFAAGLRRFAAAAGKPNLYHETITVAYLLLINERRHRTPASGWDEFARLHPDLLAWKPSILDRCYRPGTLSSPLARSVFVWPDGNPPDLTND